MSWVRYLYIYKFILSYLIDFAVVYQNPASEAASTERGRDGGKARLGALGRPVLLARIGRNKTDPLINTINNP